MAAPPVAELPLEVNTGLMAASAEMDKVVAQEAVAKVQMAGEMIENLALLVLQAIVWEVLVPQDFPYASYAQGVALLILSCLSRWLSIKNCSFWPATTFQE
ncbi:MAG TPA: hypothetical protein VKT82_20530 [Ktedonobacterales bacterium]|nr:hypothetical protein [Ktedonobacterales bacterium]